MKNKILIGPFRQIITMDDMPLKGPLPDKQLQIIESAGILVEGEKIIAMDSYSKLKEYTIRGSYEMMQLKGDFVAMPGMIDPHTHICYAGSRSKDYASRLAGVSYLEIAAGGGGIWSTVTSTRRASDDTLYDNTKFRLFRWVAESGRAGGKAHYIEYADSCDSLFSFIPGRLFWIKTRQSVVIDFGNGITPELTKPSVVTLHARSWTDFALPFNFNIKVGDILDSTKAYGQAIEGLRFCVWSRDSTKHYLCKEFYAPQLGVVGLKDLSKIMTAKQNDGRGAGYCVFNNSDADVNLSIPPLPAAMSKYKGAIPKETAFDVNPTIKITSRTLSGIVLNDIYCVCKHGNAGNRYFPAAPSLGGGVNVRVCDESMRQYGHVIAGMGEAPAEGVACNLAFNNNSNNAEVIQVNVSGLGHLRSELYNPVNGTFFSAAQGMSDGWSIDAAAGTTVYYQLLAGEDAFIKKAEFEKKPSMAALVGVYPDLAKQSVRIRFSLQMGQVSVRVAIFDLTGRKLWDASHHSREGINEIEWNGISLGKRPAASGAYILRMLVYDVKGDLSAVFEKKLTLLL